MTQHNKTNIFMQKNDEIIINSGIMVFFTFFFGDS